ncbi:ribosomal-protein-alanine N-acetyltransferase [Thalassovita gelatinovora]|uniref:Ribosomal-protein-alanine N-acetyltransferase n=1 Tax=Thalassovita gelatinovora TaxID=53501 RepID=A0A0P1FCK6_THAGE|nr:GNAT family N-acetyltransferase [Thalassovita gelatinovora]QIZ80477.1 GNAT family N-acetyltransferase [Thalassovita gelatinovora]CUH65913.1 ribosomal-protein-alanine N-acetyltransferase [Thalassovita gelatinovora]SEQ73643.1 ribosomal-protein-alanine N-acetyltransferase [Thalassovita gelatinovora]
MTDEELARIHRAAFSAQRPWTASEFQSLQQSPHVFLVCSDHAFALGRVIAGEAELLTLATEPVFQGQGQGRSVLEQYHATARTRGAETSFLDVAENNLAALHLYRTAGYDQTAKRPGYYRQPDGSTVAALLLARSLISGWSKSTPES